MKYHVSPIPKRGAGWGVEEGGVGFGVQFNKQLFLKKKIKITNFIHKDNNLVNMFKTKEIYSIHYKLEETELVCQL